MLGIDPSKILPITNVFDLCARFIMGVYACAPYNFNIYYLQSDAIWLKGDLRYRSGGPPSTIIKYGHCFYSIANPNI